MADEADPGNLPVAKNKVPGRLIALTHAGLSGNLEVWNIMAKDV